MRTAEWIHCVVFTFFALLAVVRELPAPRRVQIGVLTAIGLSVTLASAFLVPLLVAPLAASVMRDWLPAALVLVVYWTAGRFFTHVDERAQERLAALDDRLVIPVLAWCARRRAGAVALRYLELSYLFCYPLVPFAMASVYLLRRGHEADRFWTVVLAATYFCYVMVPFVQTWPPRMLAGRTGRPARENEVRTLNLWILRHASIHANTFPSAHVAASMSCALVLLRLDVTVGAVFLVAAVSIALGAVLGRYHYAADAIAGTGVALIAAVVEAWCR